MIDTIIMIILIIIIVIIIRPSSRPGAAPPGAPPRAPAKNKRAVVCSCVLLWLITYYSLFHFVYCLLFDALLCLFVVLLGALLRLPRRPLGRARLRGGAAYHYYDYQ